MAKMKKTAAALIIAALLFGIQNAGAVTDANIQAEAALLVEPASGAILYPVDADDVKAVVETRRPPDGLTKIMTVLLVAEACERGELDPRETLTMTDLAQEGTGTGNSGGMIEVEETMTVLDLMYCAYIGSSNEACNLLAQHLRGSVGNFVAAMNARARELGCLNTNFVNTHGMPDTEQYTTAWDLYLIYSAAMRSRLFSEISAAVKYRTEGTNISASRTLTNLNYLLSEGSRYFYRYCTGGRPSATYEGGYNLVASAEREGMSLVSVVLGAKAVIQGDGSTQMQNLSETKRLFEWGFGSYSWRDILSQQELVAKVPVKFGDGAEFVNLRPVSSITMLIETDVADDEFVRSVTIYSERDGTELTAPVSAGDILGEITLMRGGKPCGTVKLIANTGVGLKQVEYIKSQVAEALGSGTARLIIVCILLLFGGYITLLVRYNLKRRERMRELGEAKRKLAEERQRRLKEEQNRAFRD